MPSHGAPKIYPSLLLSENGYPLWLPSPLSNLPPEYVINGIQIGDLGFLASDGGFVYLFNVCKNADDPVNLNRVPPGFEPLVLPVDSEVVRIGRYPWRKVIKTSSVRSIGGNLSAEGSPAGSGAMAAGGDFEFTHSSKKGAILILPHGSDSYDTRVNTKFANYSAANAHHWYEYFNGPEQGMQIGNGRLYLVTGYDSCHTWANLCYSHPTASVGASLKFRATDIAGVSASLRYRWEVETGVHYGHHYDVPTPGAIPNQAVFIRGYSISVRTIFKNVKMVHAAKTVEGGHSKLPQFGSETRAPYIQSELGLIPAFTRALDLSGTARDVEREITLERSFSEPLVDGAAVEPGALRMNIPYENQNDASVQKLPERDEVFNPSAMLNDYILTSYPDATVALTHDDHLWKGVADKVKNPFDASELSQYVVDNNLVIIDKCTRPHNAWIAKRRERDG